MSTVVSHFEIFFFVSFWAVWFRRIGVNQLYDPFQVVQRIGQASSFHWRRNFD